ncbi:MAG TPA: amino acid permease [Steroidobacteraceae bacterium]
MSTQDPGIAAASPVPSLARGLSFWSATAVVVSTIIGTGVFLVSGAMALATGSVGLVIIAWIVGAVIALFGTLCLAELGAALPRAGGVFVYLGRGLGPLWGFLYGWTASVLTSPTAAAILAAGFMRFCSFLYPALAAPWLSLHLGGWAFTLTLAQPLATLVILLVTAINYLSIRTGGRIQLVLASIKIGAIVIIIVAGTLFANAGAAAATPAMPLGTATIGAVLSALVPAMWAYNGFQNLGSLAEEIQDPGRNIPRVLVVALLIVAVLYVAVNLAYFHALPFAQLAGSPDFASEVVQSVAGARGATWLTLAMCISALASLHVVIMADARIPYAMARAGLFFRFVARTHPRYRTPSGALLFVGSLGALIALTGTFEELYSLYVFAIWIFFALVAVALIRLRRTEPELERPYRVWGYPWVPAVFGLAALALTVNLWINRPVRSSIGLLIILAGVPLFYYYRRKTPVADYCASSMTF